MDNVNQENEATVRIPKGKWRDDMDPRMQAEINFATDYASHYAHGTAGHLSYTTIAKLAQKLDDMEAGLQRPQMHAPAPGDSYSHPNVGYRPDNPALVADPGD